MKFLVGVAPKQHSRFALAYLRQILRCGDEVIVLTSVGDEKVNPSIVDEAIDELSAGIGGVNFQPVISNKPPAEAIVKMADKKDADFVLCGAGSESALTKAALGAVSSDVLHKALDQSVVLVHGPRRRIFGAGGIAMCTDYCKGGIEEVPLAVPSAHHHNFLLCVTGSDLSRKAAGVLAKLLRPDDFVVIYAAYESTPVYISLAGPQLSNPFQEAQNKAEEQKCREAVVQAYKIINSAQVIPNSNIRCEVVGCLDARDMALDLADRFSIGTIVCGSRGRSFFWRLFMGSFSSYVAEHAKGCAVMVVH
eukprot:TRINITY_DN5723_c0_g1_i1.p1 TRINITY_DN5723_c0_g1~~TRINITY_DN5723_c0_g1_i1.p1  ORF type:complete len:307 (+),score=30.90 TRINITY_DN5723_c0_g1_i1:70-990(+)